MRITTKKYRVSVRFCPKLPIFAKTVGYHLWILSENLSSLKSRKNSYIGQLCITDLSYGGHGQEILCFGHFMPQTADYR
jgi:hypothetical protein